MSKRARQYVGVPTGFWDLPDVKAAVGLQSYRGVLLAALTTTCTSQVQLASACGITQSHLAKILKGDVAPTTYATITGIENALAMPTAVRAAFHSDAGVLLPSSPPTQPPAGGDADTTPRRTGTDWARMLRRTFVKAPSAILAALPLNALAARISPSDRLDPAAVQGLVDISLHYRRSYHAVPASRLLPAALAHLDVILSLRPIGRADDERLPLLTAAGEMVTLAAVLLSLDASWHQNANPYFDTAWAIARAVNDPELQAVVLAARSFAISYGENSPHRGLECADTARALAATGSHETRAWVAAVASEHAAATGDRAGFLARLDESRQALTTPTDSPWRGVGGFDAHKLSAYEGGGLVRLNLHRDAESLLSSAIDRFGAHMPRHQATALLDRADARLGLNEIDAACEDARKALRLATRVEHAGHLSRIDAVAIRGTRLGARSALNLQRDVQLVRLDNGLPLGGSSE